MLRLMLRIDNAGDASGHNLVSKDEDFIPVLTSRVRWQKVRAIDALKNHRATGDGAIGG